MEPVSVFLVDDHPVVVAGLRVVVEAEPDLKFVGSAATGAAALKAVRQLHPDVVVVDLRLPDMDGTELIAALGRLGLPSQGLVLSTYGTELDVVRAVQAGAKGYLRKGATPADIVRSIRTVARGGTAFPGELADRLFAGLRAEPLTPRELEVLTGLAAGLSNQEIARRLGVSLATVKSHINHLLSKLGARDRSQALILAVQRGLVRFPG